MFTKYLPILGGFTVYDADPGGGGGGGTDPAPQPAGGQEPPKADPAPEPKKDPEPNDPKPTAKPPWGSDDEFNPEKAWSLIENLRNDLGEQKDKVKQFEDSKLSDQEKLEQRATSAERNAKTATADAARLRVALRKGLTEVQAKRLVGETEEELEQDADELLASFKDDPGQEPKDPKPDPQRRPTERLRPGAVPKAEPDETDPRKLAEQVSSDW